jgi:hypothetical protein
METTGAFVVAKGFTMDGAVSDEAESATLAVNNHEKRIHPTATLI